MDSEYELMFSMLMLHHDFFVEGRLVSSSKTIVEALNNNQKVVAVKRKI